MMEDKINYMIQQFEKEGFAFSDSQERQFYTFYEMLIEKNKVMNLTGIKEFTEVVEKHFIDSLSLYRIMNLNKELLILDLGTGAGFPGIPLKIAYPGLKIVLMDSLQKRVGFLKEVIRELRLEYIWAVHGRAEECAKNPKLREQFDLCVSRAVANLSVLEEYCLPFVKIGGKSIAYKSGSVDKEVQEAQKSCKVLGGKLEEVYKFQVGESKRSFVTVKKIKGTPKQYPRKAGMPGKMPL
jgi:16S rRNA (guanine527-N7)-methyltransferase